MSVFDRVTIGSFVCEVANREKRLNNYVSLRMGNTYSEIDQNIALYKTWTQKDIVRITQDALKRI